MNNTIINFLNTADKTATVSLNFDGGSFADTIFHTVSCSISWVPLALLFLYFVYKTTKGDWRKALVLLLGLVLTITLCDQISSSIIKPLAMRLRPSHDLDTCFLLHYVNGYHGGRYGFVSSHAANAFGAVVYSLLFIKKRWFTGVSLLYAGLVSYSRIYLGVHFLGDVVCGAILGVIVGFAINRYVAHVLRNYALVKPVKCVSFKRIVVVIAIILFHTTTWK